MFSYLRLVWPMVMLVAVVGCAPDYSPNTYSTAAVQQANKVDQGVIAGFREVAIKSDGTVGAVAGGAAGGVLGAQEPDGGVITALSAIGGTLVGGLIGTGVEHAVDDTKAFEYIVRKTGGDLVAVAQKDTTPLPVGLKVLVIEGKQARIVADYTAPLETPAPSAAKNERNDGSAKSDNEAKINAASKTDDTHKISGTDPGVMIPGAPSAAPNAVISAPAPAPAQAPQPTAAVTPPAAATPSSASQVPASAPQADQASAAQAAPSARAPPQSAPAAASPPAQGGGSTAPPPAEAPAPGGSKSTP